MNLRALGPSITVPVSSKIEKVVLVVVLTSESPEATTSKLREPDPLCSLSNLKLAVARPMAVIENLNTVGVPSKLYGEGKVTNSIFGNILYTVWLFAPITVAIFEPEPSRATPDPSPRAKNPLAVLPL